jgi:hypothetical protein
VAEISVSALAMVDAAPDVVQESIADYRGFRPTILTPHFSGYEVLEGGKGAGSRVRWTLNPGKWTRRRAREWEISAEEVDGTLVERDAHSSAVMTWTVISAPDGRSAVKLTLTWPSPGGLGGMRARSRANKLQHLYGETLLELRKRFDPGNADVPAPEDTAPAVAAPAVTAPEETPPEETAPEETAPEGAGSTEPAPGDAPRS